MNTGYSFSQFAFSGGFRHSFNKNSCFELGTAKERASQKRKLVVSHTNSSFVVPLVEDYGHTTECQFSRNKQWEPMICKASCAPQGSPICSCSVDEMLLAANYGEHMQNKAEEGFYLRLLILFSFNHCWLLSRTLCVLRGAMTMKVLAPKN